MIRFVFILLLCPFAVLVQAQPGIELSTGYSTYSMKDLSHFLHQQADANPPIKVTNDFPNNIHFGFRLYHQFDSIQLGIEYTHYLTGGRVHYKDYSGEIGIDVTAVANSLGLYTNTVLAHYKRFRLKAGIALSAYFSSVQFNQYTLVGDISDKLVIQTSSTSFGIFPSVEPVYVFSKNLYAGMRVGGLFNTSSQLHLSDDKNARLQDSNKQPVAAQWSGFRGELFVGARIVY